MKFKFYRKTLATVALGALCIGGTTVFAEGIIKLGVDEVQQEKVYVQTIKAAELANATPIQFDLQAGWDLQRPLAAVAITAALEPAAPEAAAMLMAAADTTAAAAESVQVASTPVPVPAPSMAPAAKAKAAPTPTPVKAKSTAVAKASTAPAATTMAATAAPTGSTIADHTGTAHAYSKVINATASAYSASPEENGGYGAVDYYGNALKLGTIAVDPKIIPLGTTVLVQGYSFDGLPQTLVAKATDVGGSVKGNRIDIFIPGTRSYVSKFGIQNVQIYVLNPTK
ncbi:3D domain-containing protein [Paenibacillus koleovorans]|uniref:3D domain-containing protein n=1 Tax=Paenibacillus koleovorans TaxID=121608 RepID=UPI001FEB8A29|nr:3D domain-containing protein [Paenibacillus koleovorans]